MTATSRRDFFKLATAAVAGAATATLLEGAEPMDKLYDGDIIDTHQHLWDLKQLRLPWVAGLTGKPKDVLGHDYLLSDYAEATKGLKIAKAVYMEVDVAEEDEVKEAEFVLKVSADGKAPTVAAVIGGRPMSDGFKDYLDRFKGDKHLKGVRQVLHNAGIPPKFGLEDKFLKGVRLLGERGLIFDLCLRNDQLEDGAEMIDRCPDTRFILDHCGNPHAGKNDLEAWKKGLTKVANTKNTKVMCKVSGLYANVTAADWPAEKLGPVVRTVIDLFGWDRVMFASDWPVVNLGASLKVWVETLKQIVRNDTPANQKKLFHDNAVRWYGLA
jgi:predicted TIM-barrel fold metal-dependent hydrolase